VIRGIDASLNCTPYRNNLQALGVAFVARYYTNLERTRNPAKVLTPREAHDLCQAGFLLVVVWELFAIPTYFTPLQGQADGEYAYRYANEIIRQPENSAIYFAVDFDATQAQFVQLVVPYFRGIVEGFAGASAGRPVFSVGVYGSGAVCGALKQAGLVRYSWLSQSSGWQGSSSYEDWDIRQGPLISHPPFEFDEDSAKDEFGAFKVEFDKSTELFAMDLTLDPPAHPVTLDPVQTTKKHQTVKRKKK
jgi:Domain of unknown function (DUF1906)